MASTLYDRDFVAWTEQQAALLRGNDLSALDREHLAEEIESVGARERRELRRRLARLLQHLLKWTYQPELRSRSWATTIQAQRDELAAILDDSPSLGPTLPDMLVRAYGPARRWALEETGLLALPEACPWAVEQVFSPDFLPD